MYYRRERILSARHYRHSLAAIFIDIGSYQRYFFHATMQSVVTEILRLYCEWGTQWENINY